MFININYRLDKLRIIMLITFKLTNILEKKGCIAVKEIHIACHCLLNVSARVYSLAQYGGIYHQVIDDPSGHSGFISRSEMSTFR